jgi:hypothetical protein
MCIIIDKNTLSNVFNRRDSDHSKFKPVLDWVLYGKGKFITGGSTYLSELRDSKKYVPILAEFSRKGKVKNFSNQEIDVFEEYVKTSLNDPRCDDPHLIALVAISKCRIICTKDMASYRYVQTPRFYKRRCKRPKFYTSSENSDLLIDQNLIKSCKPFSVLPSCDQKILDTFLSKFAEK